MVVPVALTSGASALVHRGNGNLRIKRMNHATFKRAIPYADDALNLPVADVDGAIPFYQQTFGFRVVSQSDSPPRSAILARDQIQIGLAENGGDPTQEGCYF